MFGKLQSGSMYILVSEITCNTTVFIQQFIQDNMNYISNHGITAPLWEKHSNVLTPSRYAHYK